MSTYIYFLLYIDDMLLAAKSKTEVQNLKQNLILVFEIRKTWNYNRDSWNAND